MNLDACESDASGSDGELVPLDFRTALVNGKLVIQAKPLNFTSVEEELAAIESNKHMEAPRLNPDEAIGDVEAYLKSVRKEAFDLTDDKVVLIDPSGTTDIQYNDILLPCEQESRINNTIEAP